MNNKTAQEIVELVQQGKVDEALSLSKSEDKTASSYHRVMLDAVDRATDVATSAAMKVLHDKMIIADREDLAEAASDMRYMLDKWLKNYLKNF